jgi:chaperonin cofactor prefoldin
VARDVLFDYEAIENTSTTLDRAVQNIVPQLETLKRDVEGLLQNGLVLKNASPAITEQYRTFHTNLQNAINGISQFATQFRELKKNIEEMDTKVASDVRSSTAQMGTK